jgi:hypothetical protein
MNMPIVSESLRRENSRAVEKRDRWRARYVEVSLAIQIIKRDLSKYPWDNNLRVQLSCMRDAAHRMMMHRALISEDLRATAYAWAPLNRQEAA